MAHIRGVFLDYFWLSLYYECLTNSSEFLFAELTVVSLAKKNQSKMFVSGLRGGVITKKIEGVR